MTPVVSLQIDTVTTSRVVDKCHSAPDPALWEYERRLKKLATRGGLWIDV